ncbi:pitrilysin family protein [Massilia sp. TS11]|uniref:M16 family metallopeptidase n=1 Tax=Massilia sp. TS11 TaxID=2908003 RepID=UPI001EDAF7CB|nr:M16 family metallopeptidase [Massilia sp. TS11]MCG2586132.1 insulinase family protein [Massilia sp. TS11]
MLRVKYACSALILAWSLPLWAAPDPAALIPVGPQVRVGKLDNGLSFYIQRNARPEKRVEMRLVVKTGSVQEDEDQRGLAHFTEHMAFNGSTHFQKNQLIDYLQQIGVRFGADLNAYTSFDETVYILPIPTKDPAHVRQGFQVLEDWAHGLSLTDADIDAERGIVLEEMRRGKGAGERLMRKLLPLQLNGSRYAQRLPIGDETVLKTFKPDTLRRFYRDWYRPDLMAVVVVGDIDPQEAEQQIRAHFSALSNPAGARPRVSYDVAPRQASASIVATDPEMTTNSVQLQLAIFKQPRQGSYGVARERLLDGAVQNMMATRFNEIAEQPNAPFMAAGLGRGKLVGEAGVLSAGAVVNKAGSEAAIRALLTEAERVRQHGFTAAEWERVKKNMIANLDHMVKEQDKQDSGALAAEYIRNFLDGEPIAARDAERAFKLEVLQAVTLDELNARARRLLQPDPALLVAFSGSDKGEAPVPSEAAILAAASAPLEAKLAKHEDKAVSGQLVARPSGGKIVAETVNAKLGTTTLRFANGLEIILKPTSFNNDQIALSGIRYGGTALESDASFRRASLATQMAGSLGVGTLSSSDIQKLLAGRPAGSTMGRADYTESVGGGATKAELEPMLQMTHMRFSPMLRNEGLFNTMLERQQTALRNLQQSPENWFVDQFLRTLYQNHPRGPRLPQASDYAGLTLLEASGLHDPRFQSAKGFRFVMVGAFDVETVKPLLADYLGTLPVGELPTEVVDRTPPTLRGVRKEVLFKGSEAKSMLRISFGGDTSYDPDEALRLNMLNQIINIKLTEVVREKLQLVYSGGVSGGMGRTPHGNYRLDVNFTCAPDNVDKVAAAALGEIEKIQKEGPSAADIEKVKTAMRLGYERNLKENGYWASQLLSAALYGDDPERILTVAERIAAVTPAQLQAAAQRYFDMNNYLQMALKPEPKA